MASRISRMGWAWGLLAAPALAVGAGSATIQSEDQTMEVVWEDADTARVQGQGQPAYMLMRDGKLYSVSTAQGRTMVMDLSAMGAMMQGMQGRMAGGGAATVEPGPRQAAEVTSIEATGGSEVVAGIEGEVYEIRWRDSEGQSHTDRAVLSDSPLAVELMGVLQGIARTFAESMDRDRSAAVGEALSQQGLGVLRYSDRMRLTEIAGESPGADAFELPAEPMGPSDLGPMPGRR